MAKKSMQVINDMGKKINVTIVEKGGKHGRNDVLVNNSGKRYVEFYDAKYDFTEHGQFIANYYEETILEASGAGINLHGGVDGWEISKENLDDVQRWLKENAEMVNTTKIKIAKKLEPMLSLVEKDDDGYWAYTKKGFRFTDTESHTAHEETQKEFVQSIKKIEACECKECKPEAVEPEEKKELAPMSWDKLGQDALDIMKKDYTLVDITTANDNTIFILAKNSYEWASWRGYISTENNLCLNGGMYSWDKLDGMQNYVSRIRDWNA